ncbi:protein translocase subunit yidC [Arboricoccus pini]|uniref:Membrane protein insertase YidC n=1 Tax=Arboricoccus pini TaxID=1963835 RepID=A0A212Q1J9_9PROT|nr:membrane protein insertase YidC [Arboricoccus pini]SNB53182.1 protein translocase subunit yidC [Arboricoccus pini]
MSEQRNLIVAIVLSVGIILGFQYFFASPKRPDAVKTGQQTSQGDVAKSPGEPGEAGMPQGSAPSAQPSGPAADRAAVLARESRIPFSNGRVNGTISTIGNRIDDLSLVDYRETVDPKSPEIVLLSPAGAPDAYFGEFGWVGPEGVKLPDASTQWQVEGGEKLTPSTPITLRWDNGAGLVFERRLELDGNYMFTVTQKVTNNGSMAVELYPYGLVSRWGTPHLLGYYILHEGPVGVLDGSLREPAYKDLVSDGKLDFAGTGGWLGFTDKYWLAAVIPDQSGKVNGSFRHNLVGTEDRYQSDFLGGALKVPPGASAEETSRMFAGAKEVDKLDAYRDQYGIPLFDRAVDFGWFYFLTKPIFYVLDFFYKFTGNYGIAILLLTLCVKLLFFPLANKSYRSMSAMKRLQPKMTELREKYGDDKMKMNQELMALYKREKVNPMAGCLPIVVQIPVFFCLYKVLFVNTEMRHAPFFGWIHDLSAPDPTTIFNLFGLLPFTPPHALMIGALPLLMGITMFLQTKLNPQPADPVQAKVMLFLPVIFTFLFATFPAGLVIYWTWNNILSITQQWVIMKRMGVPAG